MKENVITFFKTLGIILILGLLFLAPWTLLLGGLMVYSFFVYLGIFIITSVFFFVKKKNVKINRFELFNVATICIFFNILFVLFLKLLPSDISYNAQLNYLSLYEGSATWTYLAISCLFYPIFSNLFVRNNLKFINNSKLQKVLLVLFNLFIALVQPTYIYSLYSLILGLGISIYFLKEKNIYNCILIEVINNLFFAIILLYFSEFKIVVSIFFIFILIVTLLINLGLKKE